MSIERMGETSCKLTQGFQLAGCGPYESGYVILYGLWSYS